MDTSKAKSSTKSTVSKNGFNFVFVSHSSLFLGLGGLPIVTHGVPIQPIVTDHLLFGSNEPICTVTVQVYPFILALSLSLSS